MTNLTRCAHELPEASVDSLMPRCVKCGAIVDTVAQAITDQLLREQRLAQRQPEGERWRADAHTGGYHSRTSRHRRMRKRGDGDRIGYRGEGGKSA